jgi:N4-gp56 family major capsid protein
MAETTLATASEKQKWINTYFSEYVRLSGYKPYMGKSNDNIIIIKYELQEEAGKTINIPLITRLKGSGVTGSATLDGAEEELGNYNCDISIDWRRNGVRVPKSSSFKSEIDLLNAARSALKVWEAEKMRDDITKAMLQIITTGSTVVNWADATAGNKNAWVVANSDRVLFGKLKSNYSATFASALGNIDTTDDRCTSASMSLAKRIAKNADPHIRPYMTEDGREFYVAFHGSRTFRDIKGDATIVAANKDARSREGNGFDKNPLFQDGDIIYDGIVHREVPEIDAIAQTGNGGLGGFDGQGNGTCDVRPVFLCGAQAVGVAWGQEPTPKTDNVKDYGFRPGVAIEELLGVKKLCFNGVQQGIVSCFFAAASDS